MNLDHIYREQFGRAVATTARLIGDIGLAEDAVHDAFADALRTWHDRGLPDNPGAWITTAARNRALDRLRRESLRGRKESDAAMVAPRPVDDETPPVADDRLRLIFTCCHPALTPQARVTLTLRLVCGLRTTEIARAFMQPEGTVAQRLTRAKAKIRIAGIPLRVPPPHLLPERLTDVLACIYLVFAEGYSATAGDQMVRPELCAEAVRLGRLLCELMPDEGEAHALLALMLLNDSRRGERSGPTGELLTLEEQDRSRWDPASIDEGMSRLRSAAALGRGPYLAQAAIAAAHARAPSFQRTDWRVIVGAYDDLMTWSASPAVRLNRAVAVGFLRGFEVGLAELDEVAADHRVAEGHTLAAARADLLRRLGRTSDAAVQYRLAISRVRNDQTRRYLQRRLDELPDGADPRDQRQIQSRDPAR
ncbi:RNA polymerase sigma factor [Mycolicibacterium hippocampi]|uniref:RNA polymerase subunit sigma-24 n=1 Tax=Mycolicibacterium hippocampi TaxID=659824 RepID=A0A7I9ZSW7_9MYCO|nr:sigma-70 family RNA polymerase sigma factor [Mycolicibacterium hippocampi]GFH03939.1 RNA polymerase subunit sigma-24 [Mycolicibacterium hippocampi]